MGNGTELGKVRGLGSAHHGEGSWLQQRYTAVGNLLLVGFLVISILLMPDHDYKTVHDWIVRPLPALAIALLVVSSFWHARLGLAELIGDYVHEEGNKFAALLVLNFAAIGGTAYGLFCIARLAIGGGVA